MATKHRIPNTSTHVCAAVAICSPVQTVTFHQLSGLDDERSQLFFHAAPCSLPTTSKTPVLSSGPFLERLDPYPAVVIPMSIKNTSRPFFLPPSLLENLSALAAPPPPKRMNAHATRFSSSEAPCTWSTSLAWNCSRGSRSSIPRPPCLSACLGRAWPTPSAPCPWRPHAAGTLPA